MERPRPSPAPLSFVAALAVFFIAAGARDALADRAAARRHFEGGTQAYQQGQYDAAIAEFQSGFREEPLPDFLFNIALSHQKARRPKEAVQYFDLFLLLATSSRDRDEAKAQAARLRREYNLPDSEGASASKSPALQFDKTGGDGAKTSPAPRWPIWVAVAAGVVTVAAVTTAAVVATRPAEPPVLRLEKVP